MRDVGKRQGQEWNLFAKRLAPFDAGLGCCRTDLEKALCYAGDVEFDSTRNIDEDLWIGQSHIEDRHQRLPAGQYATRLAGLLQHLKSMLGGLGTHIVKARGLHRRSPNSERD